MDCTNCPMRPANSEDPAALTLEINQDMLTLVTLGDHVPQRLQQVIDYAGALREDWGEEHPDEAATVLIDEI